MKFIFGIAILAAVIERIIDQASGLSESDKQVALDEHNNRRSNLAKGKEPAMGGGQMPSAKNMYKFKWSPELENIAQRWADRCQFGHSSQEQRNGAGENIYMSSGQQQPAEALREAARLFWNENVEKGVPELRMSNQLFSRGVGHFTQMAWAATTELGCGVKWCPNKPMTYVVCNYKIPGNMMNDLIYESGSPCQQDSDCTTYQGSTCSASEGLCQVSGAAQPNGGAKRQQGRPQERGPRGQGRPQNRRRNNWRRQQQGQGPRRRAQQGRQQQQNPWGQQQGQQQQNPWG